MRRLTQANLLLPYLCGFFEMQGYSLSVIGLSGSFTFCLRQQQKVRHSLCELVPETFVDSRATRREVLNLELIGLPFIVTVSLYIVHVDVKWGNKSAHVGISEA